MLKDADAFLAALAKWAADYPVLGFLVMGFTGGLVAVLVAYQKAGIEFTVPTFIARCIAKGLIGVFLGFTVFFACRAWGVSSDWGYILAAICGLGGTDIAEAVVVIFIDWLRRRSQAITPNPPNLNVGRAADGSEDRP